MAPAVGRVADRPGGQQHAPARAARPGAPGGRPASGRPPSSFENRAGRPATRRTTVYRSKSMAPIVGPPGARQAQPSDIRGSPFSPAGARDRAAAVRVRPLFQSRPARRIGWRAAPSSSGAGTPGCSRGCPEHQVETVRIWLTHSVGRRMPGDVQPRSPSPRRDRPCSRTGAGRLNAPARSRDRGVGQTQVGHRAGDGTVDRGQCGVVGPVGVAVPEPAAARALAGVARSRVAETGPCGIGLGGSAPGASTGCRRTRRSASRSGRCGTRRRCEHRTAATLAAVKFLVTELSSRQ